MDSRVDKRQDLSSYILYARCELYEKKDSLGGDLLDIVQEGYRSGTL